jgi:uncharacterized protein YuzE
MASGPAPTDEFDIEWFLTSARRYLGDRSNEELGYLALDIIHAVSTRATEQGRPLMAVARGDEEDEGTPATRGTFDPEAHAAYVQLAPVATKVARTVEAIPGQVNVDYDADGGIIGAEFLGVFLEPGGQWLITRVVPEPPAGDPVFGPHNQDEK